MRGSLEQVPDHTPPRCIRSGIDLLKVTGGGYDGEVSPEYVERIASGSTAPSRRAEDEVARVVKRYAIEDVSDGLQFDLLKTGLDNRCVFRDSTNICKSYLVRNAE